MADILDLPGTFNTRVAGTRADGRPWLLRSAHLDRLQTSGHRRLLHLGVTTVVDLRDPSERLSPRLPGLEVHHVPLYQFPDGPPQTGTLPEICSFLLNERGGAIAEAAQTVDEAPGPALVHCAIGKDRTGLVTALLRRASGDALPAVLKDYALSAGQLPEEHHRTVLATLTRRGLDEQDHRSAFAVHTTSPNDALAATLQTVETLYGGASGYLRHHGMSEEALITLGTGAAACS
ncbi:tyrosine-protein phosphatase [Nesterenkonia xinjiangensis]|uniref:Protein-tyrosine phosphatase n=1 Tax=Nesterenkonia xinjiangensis TaxID=225327 RepID=A0A7Z0KA38_9MICC|nr:protein-tyrosine phosphatase [Nesterenkonia xinjiangensis]